MTVRRNVTIEDIPALPGYLTVAAVSEIYGIRKNSIYRMLFERGDFPGAYKVPWGGDEKFILLLPEHEVKKVFKQRELAKAAPLAMRTQLARWNRRVKDWGSIEGWQGAPIHKTGAPPPQLVQAYQKAHPEDPRPQLNPEADALAAE